MLEARAAGRSGSRSAATTPRAVGAERGGSKSAGTTPRATSAEPSRSSRPGNMKVKIKVNDAEILSQTKEKKATRLEAQFAGDFPDDFSAFEGAPMSPADEQVAPPSTAKLTPRGPSGRGRVQEMSRSTSPGSSPLGSPRAPPEPPRAGPNFIAVMDYILQKYKTPKKAFRAIDTDGGGYVTLGELNEALDRLRIPWREITNQDYLKGVVRDHQKVIRMGLAKAEFDIYDVFGKQTVDADNGEDESNSEDDEHYLVAQLEDKDEAQQFAAWASEDNRWNEFVKMFNNVSGAALVHGCHDRQETKKQDFLRTCNTLHYSGNGSAVFNMIQSECLTMRERANRKKGGVDDRISSRQFRNFERRAMQLIKQTNPSEGGSALSRLKDILVHKNGSLLRGWRLDIDVHGTGKVGEKVFGSSCRALGLLIPGKSIWNSLRKQNNDPLEFREVDQKEADNIDSFVQILWEADGANLEKAWQRMDPNNQNYLAQEEFESAARKMGFVGDPKMLFLGLKAAFTNRVTKSEFMYLGLITSVTKGKMTKSTHLVHELIQWVHGKFGSAAEFVYKLGLSAVCPTISVSELCSRLTAMGFPGKSQEVANRAARLEGGVLVSAPSLYLLLDGKKRTATGPAFGPVVWSPRRSPLATSPKPKWDNGVDDYSMLNQGDNTGLRPPMVCRKYFHSPGLGKYALASSDPLRQSPSAPSLGQRSPSAGSLGGWQSPMAVLNPRRSRSPDGSRAPDGSRWAKGGGGQSPEQLHPPKPARRATIQGLPKERQYRKSIIKMRGLRIKDPERDEWQNDVCTAAVVNASRPSWLKESFSDGVYCPLHRGRNVKDEMAKRREQNGYESVRRMAESNRKVFNQHMVELGDYFTAGEKVLLCIKAMLDASKKMASKFFYSLDQDGSGELDGSELGAALSKLGFDLAEEEVEAMLDLVDKDGSGDVSVKELCQALRTVEKKAAKGPERLARQHTAELEKKAQLYQDSFTPSETYRCAHCDEEFMSKDDFDEHTKDGDCPVKFVVFSTQLAIPKFEAATVYESFEVDIREDQLPTYKQHMLKLQDAMNAWNVDTLREAIDDCLYTEHERYELVKDFVVCDFPPKIIHLCEERLRILREKLEDVKPLLDQGIISIDFDVCEIEVSSRIKFEEKTPPDASSTIAANNMQRAKQIVQALVSVLKVYPRKSELALCVQDHQEYRNYLHQLADNRATCVTNMIAKEGVKKSQIVSKGYVLTHMSTQIMLLAYQPPQKPSR